MLPLALSAPNFFGIGEFLSGVIVGAVGLVVLFVGGIVISEWIEELRSSNDDYEQAERKAARGKIICDYIEQDSLKTIARQSGVPLDPDRLEEASASGSESGVGAGSNRLTARWSQRREQQRKAFYDEMPDYHLLLRQVLRALEEKYELNTQLGALPLVDYMDESFMGRLSEVARESEREAVASIRDRIVSEEKAKEFTAAATGDQRLVLVESDWRVTSENGELLLTLAKLHRRDEYGYGGGEYGSSQEAPMPHDIALEVRLLEPERMTIQGKNRLRHDARIQAGVFGAVTSFDESRKTLSLSPTAIFARHSG